MAKNKNQKKHKKPNKIKSNSENAFIPPFTPDEFTNTVSSKAKKALSKHEDKLLAIPGVQGVSVQIGEIGEEVVIVFVDNEETIKRIPDELDGVRVETEIVDQFDAF